MNSSKAKICLALAFWITSSLSPLSLPQQALCIDTQTSPNIVIVPGTQSEKEVLSNTKETWLKDNVRVTNGWFEYKIPLLGTAPFVVDIDSSGPCNIEVSIGGDLWQSIYNSGIDAGAINDHIRRQIRIEQKPNNPFIVRFSRSTGAANPFYLLRFSILRQLELFPGTAVELAHLIEPGTSTLPGGGGRTVPAGTSISYSLSDAPADKIFCLVENEGECDVELDKARLDLIWTKEKLKLYSFTLVNPEQSKLSIKALNNIRVVRVSFFYSLINIDPTSEFGKIFQTGTYDTNGAKLEENFSIKTLNLGSMISLRCSNPESVTSGTTQVNRKGQLTWFPADNSGETAIKGTGIVYSWSLDSDPDNDSLPTSAEIAIGTDPDFADTDRDLVKDGVDLFPKDRDNDGLDDDIEAFIGAGIASFDTNSDSLADGLGLDGAARVDVCSRITDTIQPGAKYLDVTNPDLLKTCRLFGNTSLVVPFREILLSRNPESTLESWLAKADGAYGILLDDCCIRPQYYSDPVFIDIYQLWAKRIWADPNIDDDAAYKLGQFAIAKIGELIGMAKAKTREKGLALAISIPSYSSDALLPVPKFDGIDRILVTATGTTDSFLEGLKDGQIVSQPFYTHLTDGKNPEYLRSYISGVISSGFYGSTSHDGFQPLYLSKTVNPEQNSFVQVVTDSTLWVNVLDKTYPHSDWISQLSELEVNTRLCGISKLGSAKTAFLDESTTHPTYEEAQFLSDWVKQGGSLLVFEGKSRFASLTWWGPRTTLGKEIAKLSGIKEIESEKVMKVGAGNLMLTSVEPTSSIPRFFTDIIEPLPKIPCSYCQPANESIETGFITLRHLQQQDMPRYPNPIYVPVSHDQLPYVVASTCAVPWTNKTDSRINILAQALEGAPSMIAVALPGEPKAITATCRFGSVYENGILIINFAGSEGGEAFAIDLSEALDLKAVSCNVSPTSVPEGSGFKIYAVIQNISKIPSSSFSVTFHIDSPSREKQLKRIAIDSLAPKQVSNFSFDVPPIVAPGDHRIYMVITSDGEINLGNNTVFCDFAVTPKAKERIIKMQIGSSKTTIDGKETPLSSPPYISAGKTMVPFRFVAEALDAKVSWDQFEKMVTIVKGDVTIFLWIGKNYAIVSGNMVNLSAPPELKNGKTFVPIRFISESLNAKVEWEPLTQTITVKMVLTN